jgi:hypothetical protein
MGNERDATRKRIEDGGVRIDDRLVRLFAILDGLLSGSEPLRLLRLYARTVFVPASPR